MEQKRKQVLVRDRLSSLPDDILVDILSLFPFKFAITTGTLSKRWRHLWTLTTSVDIVLRSDACVAYEFTTCVDQSIHKHTSPFIRTFIVDCKDTCADLESINTIDSWLRRICQRSVLHLVVLFPSHYAWYRGYKGYKPEWPSCILRTRSLVSIKMRFTLYHYPSDDNELIDLPNLKKLSLTLTPLQCDLLTKLTQACPLLEDLSFTSRPTSNAVDVKCSCPNLRRLSISCFGSQPCKVVINAPKLEYLDATLQDDSTLCIGDRPIIRLHEVRLDIALYIRRDLLSTDVEGCSLHLYKAISNVRSLNLGYSRVHTFTMFRNLTHLTLNFGVYSEFRTLLSFLKLCPVLDVLTLRLMNRRWFGEGEWLDTSNICTLERVKEIGIDVCYYTVDLKEHFTEMIDYLLKRSSVLERFCFSVLVPRSLGTTARNDAESEKMLCDHLYNCPRASIDCEVSFTGQYWLMTQKDGFDVLTPIADTVN
ncbi:hypothetical protein vseg_016566 [Gypsophila vaccaria]